MSVTHFSISTLSKGFNTLTVPYSRYTAEPVAATVAPSNHITNAMPTLPADLKITLGVAKILSNGRSAPCKKMGIKVKNRAQYQSSH